jgi:two-component system cell cycle sensor histidine kinase/response regulator CckA
MFDMTSPQILIIDDRPDNLFVYEHLILQNLPDGQVFTAGDGESGLNLARTKRFDTIILDLQMPGMDGLEVCRRLKAEPKTAGVPVIMMTAHTASPDLRVKCLMAGADDFISKPVDNAELAARIKVMLRIKQAEDQLRSERDMAKTLHQAVFNAANDAIFIHNQAGSILDVNPEAVKLLGYSKQELLAMTVDRLHPADEKHESEAALKEVGRIGSTRLQAHFVKKNGEVIEVEIHASLVSKEEGLLQGIVRDVTERNQALRALRESEERFRLLFESAPMSYQSLDHEGNFLEVNNAWLEIMGYHRDEVLGRNFSEFLAPGWQEHFKKNFPRFKAVGEVLGVEFEMLKKDGSTILVSFHGKIGYDQAGNFKQTHCLFWDITEKRKAEQEKAKLEYQLRQAQKMEALGTLAGGIAHDFNNILAAITGYAELSLEQAGADTSISSDIKQVISAAERAKNLIKQILTFSRRSEIELHSLELNQVVHSAVRLLESTLPKMVNIELDLQPGLKPIQCDPNQIEQVLMNLCTNANDAMPQGGTISIKTRNRRLDEARCMCCDIPMNGDWIELSISDTGHGMDETTLAKIFDPFFTTKEVGKGTGLGLSTVFGVVKSHRGHINCLSEPGRGATFTTYLPISRSETSPGFETQPPTPPPVGGKETVLFVDDEESIRDLGNRILSKYGYAVILAKSGEEALALLAENHGSIDLVVLDLSMPGMGGFACLKKIAELYPGHKVVITSGYDLAGDLKSQRSPNVEAYVPKPFRKADLLDNVRRVLDQQRA